MFLAETLSDTIMVVNQAYSVVGITKPFPIRNHGASSNTVLQDLKVKTTSTVQYAADTAMCSCLLGPSTLSSSAIGDSIVAEVRDENHEHGTISC